MGLAATYDRKARCVSSVWEFDPPALRQALLRHKNPAPLNLDYDGLRIGVIRERIAEGFRSSRCGAHHVQTSNDSFERKAIRNTRISRFADSRKYFLFYFIIFFVVFF